MPDDWLIFLSYEKYKGPLSINIPISSSKLLEPLQTAKIIIRQNKLDFFDNDISITLSNSSLWAPADPDPPLEKQARYDIVKELVSLLPTYKSSSLDIITTIINLADNKHPPTPPRPLTKALLICIHQITQEKEKDVKVISALSSLLGLGIGLTPEGDDFLTGFLLTINRYPHLTDRPKRYLNISEQIVTNSHKKTTRLSSNLIECAHRGHADERIIMASDSLISGKLPISETIAAILNYGETSGISALAGILTASLFL